MCKIVLTTSKKNCFIVIKIPPRRMTQKACIEIYSYLHYAIRSDRSGEISIGSIYVKKKKKY